MSRVVELGGNDYSWDLAYGCGNVVDYWNTTYVSWQFSKLIKFRENIIKKTFYLINLITFF